MKFLESIKEIWKANKWDYLISGMVVTFGCLFLYVKDSIPLEYSLSLGWFGLGFFMFTIGLFLGGNN